ncbi:unnamed protein product [Calypogeia fissa]
MKNIKMNITTRTSTMVPPISEIPHMDVWNSNADLLRSMYVDTVYFYRSTGAPDFFDGDIMREAIGKALVLSFPAAGRLARQEDGRTAIRCEGQGVLFVEADSDACIDDFGDFAYQPATQQLIPPVQTTDGIPSYPLFLFQVTRFKCGGVSFGVKVHHYVTDGVAGIQFINTISDFARGAPVTVNPWVDRTLLRARNPPTPKFPHVEYLPAPGLLPLKSNGTDFSPSVIKANGANYYSAPETESNGVSNGVHAVSDKTNGTNFAALETKSNGVRNGLRAAGDKVAVAPLEAAVVVLSKEKLATLKGKVLSKENSIRYSTYEILSAHIWKCVTRARELDGAQPTKLYTVIDGRARLVPPVPQDYFGNVVFFTTPMSTAGEIVHHPMSYAAGQIHNALARMDDEYIRSALDHLELQPDLTKVIRNAHLGGDPNLTVISWARFPIYDCDFGWGRPIFMGPAGINCDGTVHVLPSPVNDGSLTLSVGMRSDYMHKFQELILNEEDAE